MGRTNKRGSNRRHKAIYYDKHLKVIGKASAMSSLPFPRPRRYAFIGDFYSVPTLTNKRVIEKFRELGIRIRKQKDLPF